MKQIKLGFQDYTTLVFIPDPASTDGSGKTGLVAANLTVSYARVETDNDVTITDVTGSLNNLALLTTAHTDWGLLEVSSSLAPGLYRLDIADAVFASGAWSAVVYVMITTSAAAASPIEFILVAFDPLDATRMGLAALPNAAADGAGGLPISDAGGLDLDSKLANTNEITVARMGALTDWINGGRLDLILDDILLDTGTTLDDLIDDIESRLGVPSNLGSGATVAANLVDIEGQTDDIGAAGIGLTAVPWNALWDAEVQSEVADALTAYDPPTQAELVTEINSVQSDIAALNNLSAAQVNTEVDTALADVRLDELLTADSDIDGAAPPTVGSVFHELMTKTAGSFTYDQTTDSAEAIRDRGDAAWDTADVSALALETTAQAILDDTGTSGVVVAAASKTGYALTAGERNSIADAWLARVVEGAHTLGDFMRLFASVLTGKAAGGGGATISFRDLADSKNRISATVDANGNRTAVGTRDGT